MTNKNNFINGITELLVLLLLKQEDCYVYNITRSIQEMSEGYLNISQNTIYTVSYKLENEGKISEYSKLVGRKRTRVYYHIEKGGLAYLDELMENYRISVEGVEKIINNVKEGKFNEEK